MDGMKEKKDSVIEWKMNHPIVYPTVDCAIFTDASMTGIYLARKPNSDKWRFVGGFVDPTDRSYQEAAVREAKEETGMDCSVVSWVTSARIEDPRYSFKEDKIMTTLFSMVGYGEPKALDDISELREFRVEDLNEDMFVPEHRVLYLNLMVWLASHGD